MWWYAAGCLWCLSVGFVGGLWVGWFSTGRMRVEHVPQRANQIRRLSNIPVRPPSLN